MKPPARGEKPADESPVTETLRPDSADRPNSLAMATFAVAEGNSRLRCDPSRCSSGLSIACSLKTVPQYWNRFSNQKAHEIPGGIPESALKGGVFDGLHYPARTCHGMVISANGAALRL
jgi:hypothetical protein